MGYDLCIGKFGAGDEFAAIDRRIGSETNQSKRTIRLENYLNGAGVPFFMNSNSYWLR